MRNLLAAAPLLLCSARRSKRLSLWAAILPVLYSLFSALVGTQSLIFNKAVMVLWRMTLAGDNQVSALCLPDAGSATLVLVEPEVGHCARSLYSLSGMSHSFRKGTPTFSWPPATS
jgi:hypothetical protein